MNEEEGAQLPTGRWRYYTFELVDSRQLKSKEEETGSSKTVSRENERLENVFLNGLYRLMAFDSVWCLVLSLILDKIIIT